MWLRVWGERSGYELLMDDWCFWEIRGTDKNVVGSNNEVIVLMMNWAWELQR